MIRATLAEYEAAKSEIIGGFEYKEETQFPNQWGQSSKQYSTKENGTFFQTTDPNTGVVEFWSSKHPGSRCYDPRTHNKFVVGLRRKDTGERLELIVTADNVDKATHSLCGTLIGYNCAYEWTGSGPWYGN